jgi:hypothetical protein
MRQEMVIGCISMITEGEKAYFRCETPIYSSHFTNANADVKASHKLIENEFYRLESIKRKKDFLGDVALITEFPRILRHS